MNVYKEKCLTRNPFIAYPERWSTYYPSYPDAEPWQYECSVSPRSLKTMPQTDAKLNFAKQMSKYAKTMKRGRTVDERGMARLMYAIGRRNSFEECWALTQYRRGQNAALFIPCTRYDDSIAEKDYDFLYDYYKMDKPEQTASIYKKEVKEAMEMLVTDEARAKAEYILGNLVTIARRYPSTETAKFVRTLCDNWKSWI